MDVSLNTPDAMVVSLERPGLPRDRGVSGLGLVMQLGGGVGVAVGGLSTMLMIALGSPLLALCGLLAVMRSAFHRAAGSALLYAPTTARRAVWVYAVVALLQTVFTLSVLAPLFAAAPLLKL